MAPDIYNNNRENDTIEIDVITIEHDNDIDLWDEDTWTEAARNGELNLLKYAYENGYPLNTFLCSQAIGLEMKDYYKILDRGDDISSYTRENISNALHDLRECRDYIYHISD